MWHEFMEYALTKVPQGYFAEPRTVPDNAPAALKGVYNAGGDIHDILWWVNKDNPLGGGSSRNDPQSTYWEFPIHDLQDAQLPPESSSTPGIGINGEDIGGQ
jgi:hypothetical protein